MNNVEFADALERLAERYRKNADLRRPNLLISTNEKSELTEAIKGIGGKWSKRDSGDESEYASLYFDSVDFPQLVAYIPRSKVCRKTITYECDPIMSPAEEAEILQEVV